MNFSSSLFTFMFFAFLLSCNPLSPGKKESTFGPEFRPGFTQAPTPSPTPDEDDVTQTSGGIGSKTGMKVTPGGARLLGTDSAAKAVITPNDRKVIGSLHSGRISIGKNQVR